MLNRERNFGNNDKEDYYDRSSLAVPRTHKLLSSRISLDPAYDTDGAIGIPRHHHHHHHHIHSSDNYEHLVSPRLLVRRPLSKQLSVPLQQRLSQKWSLPSKLSINNNQNHDDKNDDSNNDDDKNVRRRHIRLSRRIHQPHISSGNHGGSLTPTASKQPLRIIFMRHSERANQALGPDWFNKAFRKNTYQAYDQNLPHILPKRRFDQAYEYDAPLTVRGLKTARLTGHAMMNKNLTVDVCLSSTALRCIQTCERILTGMGRRDRIAIRIEPGLFECPHFNQKLVDSFMTKKELMDNRYNIKHEYTPLIPKVNVPETLDEYFDRSSAVIRGIVDRYGQYGGTVLIVTHAPGLLALTDAIKGVKPNTETFYRTVSTYSPLAMYIAEYDGLKWKYSDQPFNITSIGQ